MKPNTKRNSTATSTKLIAWLGRFLAVLFSIVLLLPALLLPLTTAVPAWVWAPLLLAGIACLILQFRLKPYRRGLVISLSGLALGFVFAVAASQVFAATPPILAEDGKPLAGSIASLEKITLNGSEQWISLRGQDARKPVLLHLGMGGPGGGFATRSLFEPLEEHFVVVSWDEPGTGKSSRAVPMDELTPERFIEDAHALTHYLRQRFQQEKIYVYGVSWTSILPGSKADTGLAAKTWINLWR